MQLQDDGGGGLGLDGGGGLGRGGGGGERGDGGGLGLGRGGGGGGEKGDGGMAVPLASVQMPQLDVLEATRVPVVLPYVPVMLVMETREPVTAPLAFT